MERGRYIFGQYGIISNKLQIVHKNIWESISSTTLCTLGKGHAVLNTALDTKLNKFYSFENFNKTVPKLTFQSRIYQKLLEI